MHSHQKITASLTGLWLFISDIFTDKDILPSVVSDRPCQGNKHKSTVLEVETSNSGGNSRSSTSGFNAGTSTSEGNEHHPSPVDNRSFPKGGVNKETRKRKSSVSAILTYTPAKPAMESAPTAHHKPARRNKLFRAATKILYGNRCRGVQKDDSFEEEDKSECFCIECADPYSVSRAPTKWLQCIDCHK
jgi:hypothetical protein